MDIDLVACRDASRVRRTANRSQSRGHDTLPSNARDAAIQLSTFAASSSASIGFPMKSVQPQAYPVSTSDGLVREVTRMIGVRRIEATDRSVWHATNPSTFGISMS